MSLAAVFARHTLARAVVVVAAPFVAAAVTGCATVSPAPVVAGAARDFVPLAVGARYAYRVVPGPPEPQELSIVSVDDAGYFINSRGEKLAPRTDGVFDGVRFVLKDPVQVGATWVAIPKDQPAENYSISAVGLTVVVPAGTFADCVQVEGVQAGVDPNSGRAGKLLITWTYAKNVGLVKVVQRMQLGADAPVVGATMELASYLPAQAGKGPPG